MYDVVVLDRVNSIFESACLAPNLISLYTVWRAKNTESSSLAASMWWVVYLTWTTYYLWMLDQPISTVANALIWLVNVLDMLLLIHRKNVLVGVRAYLWKK